jgi:DNA-directed RNA polymerase specialized sigma24 family protein
MNPHRNVTVRYVTPATTERELLEQVDDLVAQALAGDARALSAVVVTFGPVLVGVARRELGVLYDGEVDDVVQEIYAAIASGVLASWAPSLGLGEGLPWLKRLVREQAWEQMERRSRGGVRPVSPRRRCRW